MAMLINISDNWAILDLLGLTAGGCFFFFRLDLLYIPVGE